MKSKLIVPLLLGSAIAGPIAMAQTPSAFSATGTMITARSLHTATVLPDGRVLVAGGDSAYYFSQTEASAETYDPAAGTFSSTVSMTTPRSGHTATLLPNGTVLIAGGGPTVVGTGPLSSASAEIYDPATGKFTATRNMTVDRSQHTATLLKTGKVLIAGGYQLTRTTAISFPAGAELYDPATGTFVPIGPSGSYCDTATLLQDGRVLITRRDPDQDRVSHAEIYDPSTGAFVPTADMNTGHTRPTATLLASGKVLIAGGDIGDVDGASVSAELYDPATGTFTATGNLIAGRANHAATLLPDGTVLIAGGHGFVPDADGGYDNLAGAEIYNPATGLFSTADVMITGRDALTATLLPNGKVLIAGGNQYYMPWAAGPRDFVHPEVPVAELFTPSAMAPAPGSSTSLVPTAGTFTPAGDMTTARANHTATLLLDGRVLIVGGDQTGGTAELFDPANGTFTPTGNGTTGHGGTTAALLSDGRVLIAGGSNSELYDPSTGSFSPAGSMLVSQGGLTATSLQNGVVLLTGGANGYTGNCEVPIPADPELYTPSTGRFSLTGPYDETGFPTDSCMGASSGLVSAAATLLATGKTLILSEPSAELYDPAANTFSLTGSMVAIDQYGGNPTQILGRTATLMTNGKVLAAGGNPSYVDTGDFPLSRAELYDPSTGTFTATSFMDFEREFHASTLLPDGTVLITGGKIDNFYTAPPFAERYDPSTGAFSTPIQMNAGRLLHQATLLNDGRVLVTGGVFALPYSVNGPGLHVSAEFYNPTVLVPAPALISLSGDGQGQGAIWHAATGQIASPQNPAVAGETLAMYTTNLADGGVIPPQVAIGGQLAGTVYFGGAPGYPGYYQMNFRMPRGVAPGSAVSVRLTYLGRASNAVTIGVQ